MATDANGKTPTWQWVAGITMSGLMFFSSILLLAALSDIREGRLEVVKLREADANVSERVTAIEKTMPLQFESIKEWREEIRRSLENISNNQRWNATRNTGQTDKIIKGQESAAKIKDFNKIKP